MRRLIENKLAEWRTDKARKPLLLTGVRQCGKTYVLKKFGQTCFADVAYYNFEENGALKEIFENDLDVGRIVDELGNLVRGKAIHAGETLVILDEIQACPRAITALKYFCENMRELHVVGAGSLLGVTLNREEISFPVGKIDRLKMYPMSFYEFLLAEGNDSLIQYIEKLPAEEPLSDRYRIPLERVLRTYYAVGGMPEAVATWLETKDMQRVERIQEAILADYEGDFAKHAPKTDIPKLHWIWDSIPVQLAKENNKFVFSHVKEGKRSAELEDALQWMVDAGLIYRLELVKNPEVPLSFGADATYFKIYLCDVGLLHRKANVPVQALWGESGAYGNFKGAMTENYCLTELIAMGYRPYFWRSGNSAEVDFLIEQEGRVIPIEAKAELHTRAKSFRLFCKKYRPETGFRMSMKNIGINQQEETEEINLPLYLAWRLNRYIAGVV